MVNLLQRYRQTTYETCLAVCLFQAVDRINPIKINQILELQCINYSMKFSKYDFVIGHLNYIVKRFNVDVVRIVDNQCFYVNIRNKALKNIKTIARKIDLDLINEFLKNTFPIVYIDAYYLFKYNHYPHFITIIEKINNSYKIFDPWDGKEKVIDSDMLDNSIISLREYLKFYPQVLLVKEF